MDVCWVIRLKDEGDFLFIFCFPEFGRGWILNGKPYKQEKLQNTSWSSTRMEKKKNEMLEKKRITFFYRSTTVRLCRKKLFADWRTSCELLNDRTNPSLSIQEPSNKLFAPFFSTITSFSSSVTQSKIDIRGTGDIRIGRSKNRSKKLEEIGWRVYKTLQNLFESWMIRTVSAPFLSSRLHIYHKGDKEGVIAGNNGRNIKYYVVHTINTEWSREEEELEAFDVRTLASIFGSAGDWKPWSCFIWTIGSEEGFIR